MKKTGSIQQLQYFVSTQRIAVLPKHLNSFLCILQAGSNIVAKWVEISVVLLAPRVVEDLVATVSRYLLCLTHLTAIFSTHTCTWKFSKTIPIVRDSFVGLLNFPTFLQILHPNSSPFFPTENKQLWHHLFYLEYQQVSNRDREIDAKEIFA